MTEIKNWLLLLVLPVFLGTTYQDVHVRSTYTDFCENAILCMRFNEDQHATALGIGATGYQGYVTGATYLTSGCKEGNCWDYDGLDDYINIPHNLINNTFSFVLWYKRDVVTDPGDAEILLCEEEEVCLYFDYLNWIGGETDELIFNWKETTWQNHVQGDTSDGTAVDTWYHLAITYDSGTDELKLYIDSVEIDSTTETTTYTGQTEFSLGDTPSDVSSNYSSLRGVIDEFAIFDYALTPSEITEIYKYGLK